MAPMVAKRWVTKAVAAPMRAAALAASQPACPPPMTMTSNDFLSVVMDATSTRGRQNPEGVSRETPDFAAPGLFHVKQTPLSFVNRLNEGLTLLSNTEFAK